MLRAARELDDAILHLRFNELQIGVLIFKVSGDATNMIEHERIALRQSQ